MELKNSFLIILFLSLLGCNKEIPTERDELLKYISNEENGFTQSKEIKGYNIVLTYKPTNLMVSNEISNNNLSSESRIKELKSKYEKFLYFNLSYSKGGNELLSTINESREKFNQLQNTITFEMQNKVSLTNQNNDTITLIDFNSPRTYGMSKSTNIIFIFKRDDILKRSENISFKIKDIGIGIGEINFKYSADVIKNN